MDKKGIVVFLVVALALSWLIQIVALTAGLLDMRHFSVVGGLLMLAILYAPAVAAVVARRAGNAEAPPAPALFPPSWLSWLVCALIPPMVFVFVYAVHAVSGVSKPDWGLGKLMTALKPVMESMGQTLPANKSGVASVALIAGFIISAGLGATLYAAIAFGTEYGWRGYLLPRLMPLGRIPAYVLAGLFSGVCFIPLLFFWFREHGTEGKELSEGLYFGARFLVMCVLLGVILGEAMRRRNSVGLCAVLLGAFLGQLHGGGASMWNYLFSRVLEPWTGSFGIISLCVWLPAAVIAVLLPGTWGERTITARARANVKPRAVASAKRGGK